jgi:hypothetical protein
MCSSGNNSVVVVSYMSGNLIPYLGEGPLFLTLSVTVSTSNVLAIMNVRE